APVGGRCIEASLTYERLNALADRFAAGLQRLGVAKGDRVALVLPNCPQFAYCFFGTLKAGAVVVPTNPLYTVRELRTQLVDSGARVVVVLSRLYPLVAEAATGTDVRDIVVTNIKEHFPLPLRLLFTLARERKEGHRVNIRGDRRAVRLRDVLKGDTSVRPVPVAPSDLAILQYTGGTTGTPKGAMLSHRALVANVHQCRAWHTAIREGDRILAIMPFFHVYGLTEAAPVTHSNPREGVRKPGSVGIPVPDVECKIVDLETGTREIEPGEPGELCLRGPNIMDGYWHRPDETALVLRDGWLHTGDV